MSELRVRRTITLVLEGPMPDVDDLTSYVMENLPDVTGQSCGRVRYRIECQKDFLDDKGEVIPPAGIIAAFKDAKSRGLL